ncbi:MAG: FkbM family methyltransferase [Planctomycetes bacterium]|nr:FkbM family methyltransferase [Planctomycetota bacterium]
MSWRTIPLAMAARRLARATGITKPLAWLLNGRGYEARYDAAFASALHHGDVVWDVGANVGHYTRSFANHVGSTGVVVALEPSPTNFARLREATAACGNVLLMNIGLGSRDGRVRFEQGTDELGATSRVTLAGDDGPEVDIRSAASLLAAREIPPPNAIKIDVEGHEYEVVLGLGDLLAAPTLRIVGIEVHFGILQQRGEGDVPCRLETLLRRAGLAVHWPDVSHIIASRD